MGKLVQSRIDDELAETLEKLKLQGYTESEAIREGLKLLALFSIPSDISKSIVGLGAFESKMSDLGSNKKHLKGFGR